MAKHQIERQTWQANEIAEITGIDAAAQRDLRRRGFFENEAGGWLRADVRILAKLLFVKTLREAKFDLAEAWRLTMRLLEASHS